MPMNLMMNTVFMEKKKMTQQAPCCTIYIKRLNFFFCFRKRFAQKVGIVGHMFYKLYELCGDF